MREYAQGEKKKKAILRKLYLKVVPLVEVADQNKMLQLRNQCEFFYAICIMFIVKILFIVQNLIFCKNLKIDFLMILKVLFPLKLSFCISSNLGFRSIFEF